MEIKASAMDWLNVIN